MHMPAVKASCKPVEQAPVTEVTKAQLCICISGEKLQRFWMQQGGAAPADLPCVYASRRVLCKPCQCDWCLVGSWMLLAAVLARSPANEWDAPGQRTAPQELGEEDQEGDHDQAKLRTGRNAAAQHARHGPHRCFVQGTMGLLAERHSSGNRILARGVCHPFFCISMGDTEGRKSSCIAGLVFWECLKPVCTEHGWECQ